MKTQILTVAQVTGQATLTSVNVNNTTIQNDLMRRIWNHRIHRRCGSPHPNHMNAAAGGTIGTGGVLRKLGKVSAMVLHHCNSSMILLTTSTSGRAPLIESCTLSRSGRGAHIHHSTSSSASARVSRNSNKIPVEWGGRCIRCSGWTRSARLWSTKIRCSTMESTESCFYFSTNGGRSNSCATALQFATAHTWILWNSDSGAEIFGDVSFC